MRYILVAVLVVLPTVTFAQAAPDVAALEKQVAELTKMVQELTKQSKEVSSAVELSTRATRNAQSAARVQTALQDLATTCPKVSTFVVVGTVDGKQVSMCGASIDRETRRWFFPFWKM